MGWCFGKEELGKDAERRDRSHSIFPCSFLGRLARIILILNKPWAGNTQWAFSFRAFSVTHNKG